MDFILVNSYFINCEELYDENGLIDNWSGVILVNDKGNFVGTTINDDNVKELIVGKISQDKEIELYRLFDKRESVYFYEFPNKCSIPSDSFGTFRVFTYHGLGGLGDCSFKLEPYNGDYKEIMAFYNDTISKICKTNDTLKISIISQVLREQKEDKEKGKYYKK